MHKYCILYEGGIGRVHGGRSSVRRFFFAPVATRTIRAKMATVPIWDVLARPMHLPFPATALGVCGHIRRLLPNLAVPRRRPPRPSSNQRRGHGARCLFGIPPAGLTAPLAVSPFDLSALDQHPSSSFVRPLNLRTHVPNIKVGALYSRCADPVHRVLGQQPLRRVAALTARTQPGTIICLPGSCDIFGIRPLIGSSPRKILYGDIYMS